MLLHDGRDIFSKGYVGRTWRWARHARIVRRGAGGGGVDDWPCQASGRKQQVKQSCKVRIETSCFIIDPILSDLRESQMSW